MGHAWAALLLTCCSGVAQAAPILSNGPARTAAQEQSNKLTALSFQLTLFGDQDPQKAADAYLATDFRNHDVEQPSGAQSFANYFLKPAEYGNANPPAKREGPLPPSALRRLFAITDGDLTMMIYPTGGGADPSARFASTVIEVKNGRITQMWSSGPTPLDPAATASPQGSKPVPGTPALAKVPDDLTQWFATPGAQVGRLQVIVPNGVASRAQRDANKQLVQQFIEDFFVKGDTKAAARDLSPTLKSHVPGVPSGRDFAAIAHKHEDKVVGPDPQQALFALADGDLVDIGFPIPYAGDPGAWYAQSIARVQDGKITEWWYSGTPAGHPRHVWAMPKKPKAGGKTPGP